MTIVVAFTPDPAGRAALDVGIREATLRGSNLIVVNATKGESLVDSRYASDSDMSAVEELLAAAGVESEIKRPMGWDVSDLILDEVEASGATLLVVGLRNRTPVGKLLLGSVSQRLILDAAVPVMAVREPADD